MKVVIVINAKLPVLKYGGTERVMWYLAKELTKLGHKVSFLCKKGSTCDFAQVLELNPLVDVNAQIPTDTDIIHFNNTVPLGIQKPYLVTYHGNFMSRELDQNSVFVSKNHAYRYNSDSFVYNGLDWDDYGSVSFNSTRSYYHFLGKAAWSVKNVKGAINVIKSLNEEKIKVLGGYRLNLKMGIRFTFTPMAVFEGMVGGSRKHELLKGSKGLIFPVKWDEPFGLAVTESLYCGAPIFGTPYGSLPELVIPEVGFLTKSEKEMVSHLKHNYNYSSRICHEYAADLFNSKQMALEYLKKYEQVLHGKTLNKEKPKAIASDKKLLWNP